jgi:hypothetical protein
MAQTSPGARRRVTVARAHAAAQSVLRHTARLLSDHPDHADAGLLASCLAYSRIKRRYDRLAKASGHVGEENAGESAQADLSSKGSLILEHVADEAARTLEGHQARAAAIVTWDDGRLIGLADEPGYLDDRLLLALLVDLLRV